MKYASWFNGLGFLGAESFPDDWECVAYTEIDKYADAIYLYHYPQHRGLNLGDARKLTVQRIKRIPDFDIFTFGWPCQDNSIAGKRKGQKGHTRSGLLFNAVEVLRIKQPPYFIAENVPGLFSVNGGNDFYETIRLFTEAGYDVQWQVLNTRWFLPQNRERIYFVGHLRGKSRPEVFPIGEGIESGSNGLVREAEDNVAGAINVKNNSPQWQFDSSTTLVGVVNDNGNLRETEISQAIDQNYWKGKDNHGQRTLIQIGQVGEKNSQGMRVYDPDGISCQLTSQGGGWGAKTGLYAVASRTRENGKEIDTGKVEIENHHLNEVANSIKQPAGNQGQYILNHYPRSSKTKKGGTGPPIKENETFAIDATPHMVIKQSGDRGKQKTYTSDTVQSLSANPMSDYVPKVMNGFSIRRLTPFECCLLQGYNAIGDKPEDCYTKWGAFPSPPAHPKGRGVKQKQDKIVILPISDTQQYKAIGNGVSRPIPELLAKKLIEAQI